jgi:hypothetical protein
MTLANKNNQTYVATTRVPTTLAASVAFLLIKNGIKPTSKNFLFSWATEQYMELVFKRNPEYKITDLDQAVELLGQLNLLDRKFTKLSQKDSLDLLNDCPAYSLANELSESMARHLEEQREERLAFAQEIEELMRKN